MNEQERAERIGRARTALAGLSLGDAFGERFFTRPQFLQQLIRSRALPQSPWRYTDDTEMALAIYDTLDDRDEIVRDELARRFARRYAEDRMRGYGRGAHDILQQIGAGLPWRAAAGGVFDGSGSYGNGGAMRVAPVGGFFADDLDEVVEQAVRSAVVTHAHPEGQAGAVAIAVAAALAWQTRGDSAAFRATVFDSVLTHTPEGLVHDNVADAARTPLDAGVDEAVARLGNGAQVTAQDTVGFSLWAAVRHIDDFVEAMWQTVSGLGDRDTTCAIVGGIVALHVGDDGLPDDWLEAREPLKFGV